MRLVVPYTDLREGTRQAALNSGLVARFERMGYEANYYDLMRDLWKRQQTFVLLEQDIVPTKAQLEALATCNHAWCGFPYRYASFGYYNGAGCSKFAAGLMRAIPDLLDMVGELSDEQHPKRHWCILDDAMRYLLEKGGLQKAEHTPPVVHLGAGTAHGCVEVREQQAEAGVR